MFRTLLASLLFLLSWLGPPAAFAEDPPNLIGLWGGDDVFNGLLGIRVGPDGRLYTSDRASHFRSRIQSFTPQGFPQGSWFGPPTESASQGYRGHLAFGPDGSLYLTEPATHQVHRFYQPGNLGLSWGTAGSGDGQFLFPFGIAVSAEGRVYVGDVDAKRVQIFDENGVYLGRLPAAFNGPSDIDIDGNGDIYVVDRGKVMRFDSGENLLLSWDVYSAEGVTVDANHDVYVSNHSDGRVHKFDNSGNLLTQWDIPTWVTGTDSHPWFMDVDAEGRLLVTEGYTEQIMIYGSGTPLDPPGTLPPPIEGHRPTIFLHVAAERYAPCRGPLYAEDIVTTAPVAEEGAHSVVYLLGTPDTRQSAEGAGITGLQMGIRHGSQGGTEDFEVTKWEGCSILEFPYPGWPASGSGTTLTWSTDLCRESEIVVAGLIEVLAYAPTVLSITGYLTTGQAKMANCDGAEFILEPEHLGWVSFGGAMWNSQAGGCNPLSRPCVENVTAGQATTWGKIKSKY